MERLYLKRIEKNLKVLKQSGYDIKGMKFVSKKLRHKLRYGNNNDVNTTTNKTFDHDNLICKLFWGYVKRFLTVMLLLLQIERNTIRCS